MAGAAVFVVLAVAFWANDREAEAITCVFFALFLFFFGLSNEPKPKSDPEPQMLEKHQEELKKDTKEYHQGSDRELIV